MRELFPLTALGVLVLASAAGALVLLGLRHIDLILLVLCGIALAVGALATLSVVLTAVVLWLALRRGRGAEGLRLECGYPARTGFSLPSLWYVPFVKLRWTWVEPTAEVRLVALRRRLHEEVTPSRRGLRESVVRRFEVGDAFGLARVSFALREARTARLFPSVGALKQMAVVRSIASGEDVPHPGGQPEGERADLRRYAPGDPVRFVLWKVFARTRQLVVRTPERAISPSRQTYAYLVAGEGDEAAAGAARVAVETGALGATWVLGADGSTDVAKGKSQALEVLARSAGTAESAQGAGLDAFLRKYAAGGAGRAVVFVPAKPGPWLARVAAAARARSAANQPTSPVEFVVCADGVVRKGKRSWLARAALSAERGADGAAEAGELAEVVRALGASRAGVVVVDRRAGRVYAEAHRRALATEAA